MHNLQAKAKLINPHFVKSYRDAVNSSNNLRMTGVAARLNDRKVSSQIPVTILPTLHSVHYFSGVPLCCLNSFLAVDLCNEKINLKLFNVFSNQLPTVKK